MRDYLLLYVNGREHRVSGDDAFVPLSTYLRYQQSQVGTKVVCEEGDCGACSVIIGNVIDGEISYKPVNSCIQFMYQLDGTHIITVEGLKTNGELNAVQESMVTCHGAQCGYCTPGFITTMCAMFDRNPQPTEQDIKDGLTGNLCRCTGYESIITSAQKVDSSKLVSLHELYPPKEMLASLQEHAAQSVLIETDEHTFFAPSNVREAVGFKALNKGTTIVAGGTDVCVYWNKRSIEPMNLMSVGKLHELNQLKIANELKLDTDQIIVGARTTLAQLEDFIGEYIPEFKRILWLFGSPQIRNAATLAGNIANGSPIADSLPFLFVTNSQLELTGSKGTRMVNINEFYKGYKKLDLAEDEMITRICIPIPAKEETLKLYKVSKRINLDISAFTAAFLMRRKGNVIDSIRIAYGGVGPVILRLPKTEVFLKGKEINEATFKEAGELACDEITPISDVRGSSDFRYTLARNIMLKLYFELTQKEAAACPQ
jgi:xanthine dehydrogenase small subunit